jgi:hypothetical protein
MYNAESIRIPASIMSVDNDAYSTLNLTLISWRRLALNCTFMMRIVDNRLARHIMNQGDPLVGFMMQMQMHSSYEDT